MSRWHRPTCLAPDVQVRGHTIRCTTCGSEPDIPKLVASNRSDNSFPRCPPDERPGEFRFFWPHTVPYSCGGFIPYGSSHGTHEAGQSGHGTTSSAVYTRRLNSKEMRLIVLPAETDPGGPMHVNLETHHDDRLPSYETVSYAWGGEDGDNSSRFPLFVGHHWDVLLLTKNCWDMLHYLRPWRGSRMVWIDSICINQDDALERESQVAKMAKIYTQCQQAVVYLGKDLVKLVTPGQYPPRARLEEVVRHPRRFPDLVDRANKKIDIFDVFKRRYFSRVWIIQELILPRQILMPLGGMEILADMQSGKSLFEGIDKPTAPPWMRLIGHRKLPVDDGDIYNILRMTCCSMSTDPRDKIFGAHALITNNKTDKKALRPNYSLSRLHVYFGVIAHSLINLKRTEILCNALGFSAPSGQPSWLPSLSSSSDFHTTCSWFQKSILDWEIEQPSLPGEQRYYPVVTSSSGERWSGEPFDQWQEHKSSRGSEHFFSSTRRVMHVSSEALRWRTWSELYWDSDITSKGLSESIPGSWFQAGISQLSTEARQRRRWDRDPAINPKTGSLSIHLIHLFAFPAVPRQVGTSLGATIFMIPAHRGNAEMYLTADDLPLDQQVRPGVDHLFLLDQGESVQPLYLVMRKCSSTESPSTTYRLIGCCYHLCFYADPGTWKRRSETHGYNRWDDSIPEVSLQQRICQRSDDYLFLADLQPNLQDTINSVRSSLFEIWKNSSDHPITKSRRKSYEKRTDPYYREFNKVDTDYICIQQEDWKSSLRAFQGLLNDERGASPGILQLYVTCLDESYRPRIRDGHVELCIPADEFKYVYPQFKHLYREWRYEGSSAWSSSSHVRFSLFPSRKPIWIRASEDALKERAMESAVYNQLSRLTRAAVREGEDEVALIKRYNGMECTNYRSTDPIWPESILEGFGVDGFTTRVTIV